MSEIDPLIVELAAKVDRFEADLKRASRTVDQQLGIQEQRVRKLENQFRSSSAAIGTSLKGLAGTLAAAFTGRELVGLIDSYTRLQNELRVAGLEGETLASVQSKLFDLAAKNGVAVNSLAELYGKSAQAASELGASQDQLLTLTESTALALRVSGTNAQAAAGAILGLTQALASGTVRAEEFNQVNEGGLRPLLQAAVATGQFGGSVAKLRAQVLDGKVSSEQFFRAVLDGSSSLRDQASKATLTLSGALESLNARLIEYVGSNATATGATGVLSGAIQRLAENIDKVIEALSVIALAIGARYVGALGAAAIRTAGLSAAAIGLGISLNGVAATARTAGVALSGAFGGPIGLAIGAVAAGIGLLALNSEDAAAKMQQLNSEVDQARETAELYEQRLRDAGVAVEDTGKGADVAGDKVAGFAGQLLLAADAARKMADELRVADLAKIGSQLTDIRSQRAEIARINKLRAPQRDAQGRIRGGDPEGIFGEQRRSERAQQDAALAEQERLLTRQARAIAAGAAAGVDVTKDRPRPSGSGTSVKPTKARTSAAASGPSAADRAARFLDEQARLDAEILQAKIGLANSIEERASLEREFLTQQGDQRRADIDAQVAAKQLTAEQATALKAQIDALYGAAVQADEQGNIIATFNGSLLAKEIALREQADIEQRNADLADERGRAQTDALRLQFDLATTDADRRRIALQILETEQAILRQKLQAKIDSKTIGDAEKELARIALAALDAQAADQKKATELQYASPLQRYANDAKDSDKRVEEAAVRRIQELNETITDAMTNALGIKDPFLSQLIRIFLDKNIFGPLAEALQSQGGGGDFLGSLLQIGTSLFGRASGGRVSAGSIYRVNEGASPGRVEAFRPDVSGQIIPLGRMNAVATGGAGGPSGTVRVVIEEAPGFAATVRTEATGVAVEVFRSGAPGLVDAAANETLRRASRPRL